MKVEKLRKQLNELEADLRADQRELKRYLADLKDNYGLDADEIGKRLKKIDIEIGDLQKKEKRLIRKVEKALDEINGRDR
jgi:chromosome segregation ATPase